MATFLNKEISVSVMILKLETYKFLRGQPCTVKYATRLNCARSTRNQAHVPRRFGVNRSKLPSPGFPDGPVGCPCPHAMEHDPGLAILPVVQPMSQLLIFPGVMTDNWLSDTDDLVQRSTPMVETFYPLNRKEVYPLLCDASHVDCT